MNLKRSLLLPLATLALIGGGLTIGATLPDEITGVGVPTPSASAPFTLPPILAAAVTCEEDEPCFDCATMGNLICGGAEVSEPMKRAAWDAWDAAGGAKQLLVNPHARVTLTGYSLTDPYRQGLPELDVHQLALPIPGAWVIFTAQAI